MRYPNLEAEMKRRNISKADLANLLDIHVTGVYQMMNGNRVLPVSRARKIRDAFFPDMGLDYLFEEETELKPLCFPSDEKSKTV